MRLFRNISGVLVLVAIAFMVVGCTEITRTIYLERGGLLVAEIESQQPGKNWKAETDYEGFSGSGYYTWRGPVLLNTPGEGVMSYNLHITKPGKYNLRIRNRHDFHDSTDQNDAWVQMDDGPWIKTFSPIRGRWTWKTRHAFTHEDLKDAEYELDAGLHIMRIAGRSPGFSLDIFCLYMDEVDNPATPATPPATPATPPATPATPTTPATPPAPPAKTAQ